MALRVNPPQCEKENIVDSLLRDCRHSFTTAKTKRVFFVSLVCAVYEKTPTDNRLSARFFSETGFSLASHSHALQRSRMTIFTKYLP